MSSGPFVKNARYELDNGDIAPIRVQPETLALTINGVANASSADAVTTASSAVVSRGKRAKGINARTVTVVFDSAPTGYKQDSPIRLPWLVPDAFVNIKSGDAGNYLGSAVTVVGKSPEYVR